MKNTITPARGATMAAVAALLLIGGCATRPVGPSVMAMPGSAKSFDQFRADDTDCRGYAQSQVGGTNANEAAVDSGVKSAALGTAIGALAGAALGGQGGASAGAGVGLIAGTAAGVGAGDQSGRGLQRRYDNAYTQCMYAKGQKVPMSASLSEQQGPRRAGPPGPSVHTAPPPPPVSAAPGYAPPPPPAMSSAPTPSVPVTDWFYCTNPAGYYPSVAACPGGWQRVPASRPPGA